MKLHIISAMLSAAVLLGGCTKDNDYLPEAGRADERVVPLNITFEGGQSATRTDFLKNNVLWSEGDELGIFSSEAYYEWTMSALPDKMFYTKGVSNVCMTVASGAGTPAAVFGISPRYAGDTSEYTGRWGWNTASPELVFHMYYPWREAAKAATRPTAVPFTLPSSQKMSGSDDTSHFGEYDLVYASARIAMPADAADKAVVEERLMFDFDHAFAVLKIKVDNYTADAVTITGVSLASGDGQPLAGDFTLDVTSGTLTAGKTVDASGAVVDGKSSSRVGAESQTGVETARYGSTTVYLFVNPVDLTATDANTITVFTTEGSQRFAFRASKAFEAGSIYTRTVQLREIEPYTTAVLDFEGVEAKYLAGQTSYGANLYNAEKDNVKYEGDQFVAYHDAATDLVFGINDYYDQWVTQTTYKSFYGGGMAISQWNDMAAADYTNQCSVYCKDADTGKGGFGGSSTFAIAYGYDDGSPYSTDTRSSIAFAAEGREDMIVSLYVCNTTYVYKAVTEGSSLSEPLTYDNKGWFRVTFTGIDASGSETGRVEHYLADFRTAGSAGAVEGWNKVDLSTLGRVHKVMIDFEGSDVGDYGLNTPTYCAIDNIEVNRMTTE